MQRGKKNKYLNRITKNSFSMIQFSVVFYQKLISGTQKNISRCNPIDVTLFTKSVPPFVH